ncbi:MAG: chemotaxis protein CheW [Treponemataceae bacterium]
MNSEETRSILDSRALVLAREPEREAAAAECLSIVEFNLAYETYGIESSFIREVFPLKDFTPLPGAPSFVLGIVNLRGRILSVVDLKVFFGLPARGLGDLNKVIVIGRGLMEFGILADGIIGARTIPLNTVQPPIPTLTGIGAEYLKGVTAERVIILDAKRILEDENIVVRDDAD